MKSNKKRLTTHLRGIMPNSYLPAEMCSIGRDGMVDDVDGCSDYCDSIDNSCAECAIQNCFDLLGEYEDTGLTPEEIREIDGLYGDLSKDVMAYRKIGTLEECREAMEKQKAKEIKCYGDSEDGKILCPSCGRDLWDLKECGFNHCPYCGQAIDWSDGEESLPHAYNVGRVIEQLERELSSCVDYHRKHGNCGNQIYAYKNALKIVKSGGFEE